MTHRRVSLFGSIPFNEHLHFELTEVAEGRAAIRVAPLPWFGQEMGVIHGGILAAIADTASVYAVVPSLPEETRMTSIEFKINFLAAALLDRGELVGRAATVRRGRQIAVVDAKVEQGDRLVATGLFTYLIAQADASRP